MFDVEGLDELDALLHDPGAATHVPDCSTRRRSLSMDTAHTVGMSDSGNDEAVEGGSTEPATHQPDSSIAAGNVATIFIR
jgi:hypothetical protein